MNHRHKTNIAICKICGELNDADENVIFSDFFSEHMDMHMDIYI
jgi:hypothetical protein